jgi:urease accessory protein
MTMMDDGDRALRTASLVRLADSAFPSGAFSHSFGLESAIAAGRVSDEATLATWLERYLVDAWATMEGAALVLFMRDGVGLQTLDDIVTAATHASEVRNANARMTLGIFDTLAAMGTGTASASARAYAAAIGERRANGVPALAFALAYAENGIDRQAAFTACASAMLAGLAAVGTRAIPLGQRATARVLWNARHAIARALANAERIASPDELGTQAPEQEIDALVHRLLDGRLFAS